MTRSYLRLASVAGAIVLSGVAMSPALAANQLSQSGANAVTVSVAGNENGTGNVTATNDGSGEKKSGDSAPPISILKGQDLLKVGVLAQEATARVRGGSGNSAACAGLTGNGGSVAQIGDSSCLNPGQPIGLSFGNLDLSKLVVIDPASAFGQASPANAPARQVLTAIAGPLRTALASSPLATSGLTGTLGVVEARCTASPGKAAGDALITDSNLVLDVAGQKIVLADLPTHPGPNTHVPVDLDKATQAIVTALDTQLKNMLAAPGAGNGPLSPLTTALDTVQNQVIEAVVNATKAQLLTPIGDDVFDLVLNKQSGNGSSIRVTAFDLSVVPATRAQLGSPLARVSIGNVVCGPSGREAAAAPRAPKAARPAIPTAVSAGYGEMPAQYADKQEGRPTGFVLAAFAVLVATGAGAVTYRRLRG